MSRSTLTFKVLSRSWRTAWIWPGLSDTMVTRAPASLSAFTGSVISDYSTRTTNPPMSRSYRGEEGPDASEFPEVQLGRPNHARYLPGPPRAHDGPGHGRVVQHPSDGHFGGRATVKVGDAPQQPHD